MSPPADAYTALALLPAPVCVVRGQTLVFANRALEALLELPAGTLRPGASLPELLERYMAPEFLEWARAIQAQQHDTSMDERPFWVTLRDSTGRLHPVCARRVQGPGPQEVLWLISDAEVEAEAERLGKALAEATARMMRLREEQDVLECAVEAVYQQGLYAMVMRLQGEGMVHAAVRQAPGFEEAALAFTGRPLAEMVVPLDAIPTMKAALVSRRSAFHQDMQALAAGVHGEPVRASLTAHGVQPQRGMSAPIFVEDAPWGFLTVQGESLSPVGAASLELFAQSVGAALENVRHHRRAREQLELLARLQDELVRQARLAVLGEAAAVVAHEVRNPLAVILNALTLLRRDRSLGALSAQMVQTLDEEARRLDAVVRDLLQVSRPMEPRRAPVDLGVLVRRTVAQLSEVVGVEVAPGVPVVDADAHLVQLALENLLRNAVEAHPGGEPVRVSVLPRKDEVALVVEDRGPGIPALDRDRVFEPFFTTRAEGTGLGLTLVKRVADAHGARVLVEEREGGGARFTLLLPRS